MTHAATFKSRLGEEAFLKAYDAAMELWPVPFEEIEVPTRFGMTHVVVSGPTDAPPLVLLHGASATLTMWSPNVGEFSKSYRVYAIDTMGQPSKSIPDEPIRNLADYMEWLGATLDGLTLHRVRMTGMSYGGWLALNFAGSAPERVERLALLSPAGLLPIVRQFVPRAILMGMFPSRFTLNLMFGWMGFKANSGIANIERVLDVVYCGIKYFRTPPETARIFPDEIPDAGMRAVEAPVLLLIGEHEVIFDAEKAFARAQRLIPDFRGEIVANSSHEMFTSQYEIVNARVLEFLGAH